MNEKFLKIIKPTSFGPVAVLWSRVNNLPKINRILLSSPDISAEDEMQRLYADLEIFSCTEIDKLAADIKSFLDGEDIKFSLDMADLDSCSSFQQEVLKAEFNIPRGSVSTYQLIARHLGRDKGARAVGNALAQNPFPIIIPCHRAIRSDGSLGGFQGGVDMKRALLEKEGIVLDSNDNVITSSFYYK